MSDSDLHASLCPHTMCSTLTCMVFPLLRSTWFLCLRASLLVTLGRSNAHGVCTQQSSPCNLVRKLLGCFIRSNKMGKHVKFLTECPTNDTFPPLSFPHAGQTKQTFQNPMLLSRPFKTLRSILHTYILEQASSPSALVAVRVSKRVHLHHLQLTSYISMHAVLNVYLFCLVLYVEPLSLGSRIHRV